MAVYRWQRTWQPRGWFIMLTIGGGIFAIGWHARSIRFNGIDIFFGPVVLTVQPPMPAGCGGTSGWQADGTA